MWPPITPQIPLQKLAAVLAAVDFCKNPIHLIVEGWTHVSERVIDGKVAEMTKRLREVRDVGVAPDAERSRVTVNLSTASHGSNSTGDVDGKSDDSDDGDDGDDCYGGGDGGSGSTNDGDIDSDGDSDDGMDGGSDGGSDGDSDGGSDDGGDGGSDDVGEMETAMVTTDGANEGEGHSLMRQR
ncbi:hypothetical protein MMC31_000488 [Peltigera leucophlebia]|nr:hypothetical protein [Peltigera leucophlebia]